MLIAQFVVLMIDFYFYEHASHARLGFEAGSKELIAEVLQGWHHAE